MGSLGGDVEVALRGSGFRRAGGRGSVAGQDLPVAAWGRECRLGRSGLWAETQ